MNIERGHLEVFSYFLLATIALPLVVAAVLLIADSRLRKCVVMGSSAILFGAALYAAGIGQATLEIDGLLAKTFEYGIMAADFGLLLVFLGIGYKMQSGWITGLALAQLIPMVAFEVGIGVAPVHKAFYMDQLSVMLVLLINIIGPLIAIFALKYMDEHEHHLHLDKSRQHIFFAVIFLFLGAMNGLVLANNVMWVYFFWEVTTLCSFLLIGHDRTEVAIKNARLALILNSLGGVAFVAGIIFNYYASGTFALDELIATKSGSMLLLPLAMLCLAGMTKSAQLPFQSWLLGAMVAPTPVSALLHSSTMVNAGVYLIFRLSPIFLNTWLAKLVTVIGAFTFAAAALLAIPQTNAKRILAYSTISNLGLIVALSPLSHIYAAYAAGLLIMLHGVSKGLLFLCVGAIEQRIGSRDIEDMDGIRTVMPITATLAVLGAVSMLLPPFGMLIVKWIGIEVSVQNPVAMLLIILGSAFTVLFWSKFIAKVLSTNKYKQKEEVFSGAIHAPLVIIAGLAVALSAFLVEFNNYFMSPYIKTAYARFPTIHSTDVSHFYIRDFFGFNPLIFFGVLLASLVVSYILYALARPPRFVQPYLAGENHDDEAAFKSLTDAGFQAGFRSYTLKGIIEEGRLTTVSNVIAVGLISIMFGVIVR